MEMSSKELIVSRPDGGLINLPSRGRSSSKETDMSKWFIAIAIFAVALLASFAPAQDANLTNPGGNGGLVNLPGGGGKLHNIATITWHDCDGIAVAYDGTNVTPIGPWYAFGPALAWAVAIIGGGETGGTGLPSQQVISTTWVGRDGLTHNVSTPVPGGTNGPETAIRRHDDMVKLMLQYYPKQ